MKIKIDDIVKHGDTGSGHQVIDMVTKENIDDLKERGAELANVCDVYNALRNERISKTALNKQVKIFQQFFTPIKKLL